MGYAVLDGNFNICLYDAPPKTIVYGNPWSRDQTTGKCGDKEHLDVVSNANGKFAQCMPIISRYDYQYCPLPPNFDYYYIDAFQVQFGSKIAKEIGCVLECTIAPNSCPGDSQCMDAPAMYVVRLIKKICYYKQPASKKLSVSPPTLKELSIIEA